MNIRHLRYFVALARESNHARAAAACNVTQPTLSEAVRQLEHDLAVPLIDRNGQRFRGLTRKASACLSGRSAFSRMSDALEQELPRCARASPAICASASFLRPCRSVPLITNPFSDAHPLVTLRLLSHSSIEIQRGLDEGTLEAGLTYLDNEPLRNVTDAAAVSPSATCCSRRTGGAFDSGRT